MKPSLIFGFIVGIIAVDLFLFPLDTFAEQNTKNLLAVFGVVCLFFKTAGSSSQPMGKEIFHLLLFSCIFGFICFVSVILNGTSDYTYVTYPATAVVWLASAYGVVSIIEMIHSKITIRLVGNYLIAVCAIQCVLAQVIDLVPAFSNLVDSLVDFGQDYYRSKRRIYGIACALDPAGIRLAATLVVNAYLILNVKKKDPSWLLPAYIFLFGTITVLGNMIARTTTTGALLGVAAIIFFSVQRHSDNLARKHIWKWVCAVLAVMIPLVIYFYNHNQDFHSNLRFAFEGFFNWIERGTWETDSTNVLKTMYVWPDNAKTWIIGDGYFLGAKADPYYTGPDIGFFYMNTDVGICRFIFYCGVIGLLSFAAFFAKAADVCSQKFEKYSWMFWSIVVLNIGIWFKVSTDCFLILALFVVMSSDDEDEQEELDQMEEEQEEVEAVECV